MGLVVGDSVEPADLAAKREAAPHCLGVVEEVFGSGSEVYPYIVRWGDEEKCATERYAELGSTHHEVELGLIRKMEKEEEWD